MSSAFLNSLFRFVTSNTPIWIDLTDLDSYINKFYLMNGDFASVIDYIAEKGAMVPWKFYKVEMVDGKEQKEEIAPKELVDLWKCPNSITSGYEFRKELFSFFLIFGDSFINGIGPDSGPNKNVPVEMWTMPPRHTTIIGGGPRKPIESFSFNFDPEIRVPATEVMHTKNFNPRYDNVGSHLRGMSKAKSLIMAVTGSNAAYTSLVSELQSGHPIGFLKPADNGNWLIEQIAAFQEKIRQSGQAENRGKVPFTSSNIEFVKIGESLVRKETIDSILSNLRAVCRRYSVSSRLFNDPEAATLSNYEQDIKRVYEDAIKPLLKQFQDDFNAWLLPLFSGDENWEMEPDYSSVQVLQKNLKDTALALSKMEFLTWREKYRIADITPDDPEDEILDTRTVPFTMSGLGQVEDVEGEDDEDAMKLLLDEYQSSNGIHN